MRAQDDLVRSGKILYLGISNAPAWIVAQAQCLADRYGWAPLISLQVEYNLVNRTAEFDLVPMAHAMGLGISPWSPTAGGLLTGKYGRADMARAPLAAGVAPTRADFVQSLLNERSLRIAETVAAIADEKGCRPAQLALRWLLDQPGVCSPIIGCRSEAQLLENICCLDLALSEEQRSRLDAVSRPEAIVPYNVIEGDIIMGQISGGTNIERR